MLLKLLQILIKVENCSSMYFYWNNSKTDISGLKMKKILQKKMFDSSKVYLKDCKSIFFWWKNLSLPLTKAPFKNLSKNTIDFSLWAKQFLKIALFSDFNPLWMYYLYLYYYYYIQYIITKPIYLLLLPPYILVKVLRKSQNYKSAAV